MQVLLSAEKRVCDIATLTCFISLTAPFALSRPPGGAWVLWYKHLMYSVKTVFQYQICYLFQLVNVKR